MSELQPPRQGAKPCLLCSTGVHTRPGVIGVSNDCMVAWLVPSVLSQLVPLPQSVLLPCLSAGTKSLVFIRTIKSSSMYVSSPCWFARFGQPVLLTSTCFSFSGRTSPHLVHLVHPTASAGPDPRLADQCTSLMLMQPNPPTDTPSARLRSPARPSPPLRTVRPLGRRDWG